MTVDEELARDRRLYGNSFEHVDRNGLRTRLDPSTVKLTRDADVTVAIAIRACARKAAQLIIFWATVALIIGVCIGTFL